MHQMSTTINDVSHQVQLTAQRAEESTALAARGRDIAVVTRQSIETLKESVDDIGRSVGELSEQTGRIAQAAQMIEQIADQTNLLALNAAIEAARAGESGRGFAVVADEVRKLAEQTKGSSERISNMVFQIQRVTQDASKSMEDSVELVQAGIQQADSVSTTIERIKANADRVSEAIQSITVSMQEQSNVSVEISRNVERVAQMTEENTATIAQNRHVSEQISDLAVSLSGAVSVFKT